MLILCAVTERVAILGASRGIGLAIAKILENEADLFLVGRKIQEAEITKATKLAFDLTDESNFALLFSELKKFSPTRLFRGHTGAVKATDKKAGGVPTSPGAAPAAAPPAKGQERGK